MKIYTSELGHMNNLATIPIYGKNLKKSSSPEPIVYGASCMGVLPKLFKL